MLVKKWMSQNVVSVDPDESMQQAVNLMKEHGIRLLPVIKGKGLVGILSDGDLKKASVSGGAALDVQDLLYRTYKTKIRDIMTREVVTIPEDQTIEEAAQVLLERKISGAPAVDHKGGMVGVITRSDIFRVLISLTAMGARGVQFAFHVKDRAGAVKELTDVIRANGGRIAGIVSSYEGAPPGHRNVYIRTFDLDRAKLPHITADLKSKATMLYLVDHRENRREIFV